MAILPVSNMLQATDVVGNFQRGLVLGQQQREAKRQDEERQQLRNLAPSIQQGDPAAFGQAAAINPEYAAAQQGAGDDGLRRLKGAIGFIEQAQKSGNPQAVEAAYQQVRPYLARFGQQPPATFAEAEPKFMEAKARIAMLDQGGQQQRNLSVSPGSAIVDPATGQVIYERPFAPQNQSFEFNGPDGRPRRFTFNTRTAQYEEAQLGGGAPQPTRFQTSTGEVIDISQVSDPNVRAQILANPQQFGMVPDGGSVQLPPAQGGMPLVGRAPEEQAALTTGAQEAAKLQYLPEAERIKTEAAISQAAGTAAAKGEAEARLEARQNLPRVLQESNSTISLIDKALNHPGRATATGASSRLDPRNFVPGTAARDFQVLLDQIKGGTFLQAFQSLKGGGAITETEGRKAEQAIARLDTAQSEEAFVESLQELRQIAQDAIGRAERKAQGGQTQRGPQPGQVEDGYRFRGGNPADPNNWERL